MSSRFALLAIALVLVSASYVGASGGFKDAPQVSEEILEINAATMASARSTSCMPTESWQYVVLSNELTRASTTSAVATSCNAYRTNDCSDTIPKQVLLCASNSCDQAAPSIPISASEGWVLRFDVAGMKYVKCTLTPTAGAAGDTVITRSQLLRD